MDTLKNPMQSWAIHVSHVLSHVSNALVPLIVQNVRNYTTLLMGSVYPAIWDHNAFIVRMNSALNVLWDTNPMIKCVIPLLQIVEMDCMHWQSNVMILATRVVAMTVKCNQDGIAYWNAMRDQMCVSNWCHSTSPPTLMKCISISYTSNSQDHSVIHTISLNCYSLTSHQS